MAAVSQARRFLHPLARSVRRHMLPRLVPPPPLGRKLVGGIDPVRIVGLLSSASGLGHSARLCSEQLFNSGHAISTCDVAPLFGADDGVAYAGGPDDAAAEAVHIVHLNPPKLLPGILRSGYRRYYRTFNVGYWAWELETLPPDWIDAIRFVDAVMVPSEFCRMAVARYTDKPVLTVPHPVTPATDMPPRHVSDDTPFTVLAMLNFGSSFERKNPYAALKAFKLAFASDPDARLIFKTSGGHRYPGELDRLRAFAGDMSNVEIIDELWSAERLMACYRNVDAYLSLHRSEGYGLTIAEAMMMECPVIVTAWSGNMDFCTDETAFLIGYDLIAFRDEDRSYEDVSDARWADPSADEAAGWLRHIRANPEVAHAKAKAARKALIAYTSANSYDRALKSLTALRPAMAN